MLSIGLKENKDQIKNAIDRYDFGNNVEIKQEKINDRFFLKFYLRKEKEIDKNYNNDNFYHVLSLFITEIIVEYYLKDILLRKVFMKYNNFNREEKVEIVQLAYETLHDEKFFSQEKKNIFNEVYSFICNNDMMIIDGFINFRLKFINKIASKIVEKSVEEFSVVKEYREFINILQYFVEIQEPKVALVNVIIKDGEYKLLDKDNNVIDSVLFKEIINELEDEGLDEQDLLISTLITIAPEEVIVHTDKKHRNDEIVNVIENVFIDKVIFCDDCSLCNIKTPLNKENK